MAARRAYPPASSLRQPVAIGAVAGAHGVAPGETLAAYLQAFAGNLVEAAPRLGIIGQTEAVAVLAVLEDRVVETAQRAERSRLDDLGSATMIAEVMAMKHETQASRIFRS